MNVQTVQGLRASQNYPVTRPQDFLPQVFPQHYLAVKPGKLFSPAAGGEIQDPGALPGTSFSLEMLLIQVSKMTGKWAFPFGEF